MKIVTHNGHFHADELLAVAMLLLKYPDAEVVRSRDENIISSADIVVDVGHLYEPNSMRFDHHQLAGAGARENGIPYASSGLIWKHFGVELAGGEEEARAFDEEIVMAVDALDNGISIYSLTFPGVEPYTLGDYFESFAKGANTLEAAEKAFFEALPEAKNLIKREIIAAQKYIKDKKEVERIYNESENKKIIVLPVHMHWKRALIPTEAQFVIYPRTDGNWGAQVVPATNNSFSRKMLFPESWGGLKDGELASVSGVSDAFFCHRNRHLAGAQSKEGAIKLAEIALNS